MSKKGDFIKKIEKRNSIFLLWLIIIMLVLGFFYQKNNDINISKIEEKIKIRKEFIENLKNLHIYFKEVEVLHSNFLLSDEPYILQNFKNSKKNVFDKINFLKNFYDTYEINEKIEKLNLYISDLFSKLTQNINIKKTNSIEISFIEDFFLLEKVKILRIKNLIEEIEFYEKKLQKNNFKELKKYKKENSIFEIIFYSIILFMNLFLIFSIKRMKNNIIELFENLRNINKKYIFDDKEGKNKNEIFLIEKNLEQIINHIKQIAKNNFHETFNEISEETIKFNRTNLTGEVFNLRELLLKNSQEKEKNNLENEKKRWINKGVSNFVDILRKNNDNVKNLSYKIITSLIHYLEANQGGLFIMNDKKTYLELIASYAFDRKKFLEKKIFLGEGLLGTCALEKKTIFIKKIPNDYMEITSGMGGTNPNSLLIVPLKLENEIMGIIEIASFEEFTKEKIEFLELISENIASAFHSLKINIKTKELLKLSNEKQKEKEATEEEMRQNMEELKATQEDLERKELESREQLNAINETNIIAEFDLDGNFLNVNKNFCKAFSYSKNEILNKKDSFFLKKNFEVEKYNKLWYDLKNKKFYKGEFLRIGKNNKEVYLKGTYAPIFNLDGNCDKILMICFDITKNKLQEIELKEKSLKIEKANTKNLRNQKILEKALTAMKKKIKKKH